MRTLKDVHQQFASFFHDENLKPFAWYLSKKMEEGHICIPLDEVYKNAKSNPWSLPTEVSLLWKIPQFVGTKPDQIKPFILYDKKLYLHRYFRYETQVIDTVHRLLSEEKSLFSTRLESLLEHQEYIESLTANKDLNGIPNHEKIDWQLAAAILACLNSFTIITGGPGTGKTTTVAKVLSILFRINPELRVALAAPTGKAAVRMAESLKSTTLSLSASVKSKFESLQPSTIHRLLKYIPDSVYFAHNAENPLPYEVIIVDEASMIDMPLFAKLLDAVKKGGRIIFLGDKNQLAPVEAGSLLGDLCKCLKNINDFEPHLVDILNSFIADNECKITSSFSGNEDHPLSAHIIELLRSHRFTSTGGIGKLSRSILENQITEIKQMLKHKIDGIIDFDENYSSEIFNDFIKKYEEYIRESDIQKALHKLSEIRVLLAVRDGEDGLYNINKKIEEYLIYRKLIKKDKEFYEHRPVIITKNNKDLKLYNGDIGIIRKDANGQLRAWFEDSEGKIRSVIPAYLNDSETVYAMTIHKSQGSEYEEVLVILPRNTDSPILTRELLYTAVTRAKKRVLIQGTENIIIQTTSSEVKRGSGIIDRFSK